MGLRTDRTCLHMDDNAKEKKRVIEPTQRFRTEAKVKSMLTDLPMTIGSSQHKRGREKKEE